MGRGRSPRRLAEMDAMIAILAAIQPASVRAVAYQAFNRKLIPDMSKRSVNRVSRLLTDARWDRRLNWAWVVDETRSAERVPSWDNPSTLVNAAAQHYRKDRWQHQPCRIEVWAEKGTVRGTLRPVLDQYGVTFRPLHGHTSTTSIGEIADLTDSLAVPLIALYCGDWDPSGMHMSERDLPERLERAGADVDLRRVALTVEDTAALRGARFSVHTKSRDPRYHWFLERYGAWCWEVDALSPNMLRARVEEHIRSLIDWPAWEQDGKAEAAELASIQEVVTAWNTARGR